MPENVDMSAFIGTLIYIIPLITLVIAVLTFTNAVKERHGKTAAEAVEIKKDIEILTEKVSSLEEKLEDSQSGFHENKERISNLETRMESVEKRVKTLEGHHTTR